MTNEQARELIRSVLHQIAPEADIDEIGPGETMQEALDLDSVDFLNFAIGLHEATGLEIPEADYPQLSTIEGCTSYLAAAG